MTLSLGALARREYLGKKPFGFHRYRTLPVRARASLMTRGGRYDSLVRIKFELMFVGESLKDKRMRTDRIIEWWRHSAYEEVIAEYIRREPYDFVEPRVFVVNGLGEPVA